MAKTYIPMAVYWASGLHKRLTRNQTVLSAGKTTQQITALVNLINCLAQFLSDWPKPEVNE